jgi:hypothetical protein
VSYVKTATPAETNFAPFDNLFIELWATARITFLWMHLLPLDSQGIHPPLEVRVLLPIFSFIVPQWLALHEKWNRNRIKVDRYTNNKLGPRTNNPKDFLKFKIFVFTVQQASSKRQKSATRFSFKQNSCCRVLEAFPIVYVAQKFL